MRHTLVLVPILLTLACSTSPTRSAEIEFRDTQNLCESLAKECYGQVGDKFDAVDCAEIQGCCEQIGTACDCFSGDANTCVSDKDCEGSLSCIDGWCVDSAMCALDHNLISPWLCPSQCVDSVGDPMECPESFACYDVASEYCVPCVVCEACEPGCDYLKSGLICKGNVQNDLVQPPTCIHIESFNYTADIQWVQVRNVCQTPHSGKFELRWGGLAYEHSKPYLDPIAPGDCVVLRNFEPRLGNPQDLGVAQAIGVFAASAVLEAKYPRDAVLYGMRPNDSGLATPDFVVHSFGFGGEHEIGEYAYREGALSWGTVVGARAPDCK